MIKKSLLSNSQNKIILAAFLLSWFMFVAVFVMLIQINYLSEMTRISDVSKNLAYLQATQIKTEIEKMDLLLIELKDQIEARPNFSSWKSAELNEILAKRSIKIKYALSFMVWDAKGNYIGEANGKKITANISDRTYFIKQKENPNLGLVVSEPLKSRSYNEVWVLNFSRRINDKSGNFVGMVGAVFSLEGFEQNFSQLKIGEGGNVTLKTLKESTLVARFPSVSKSIGKNIVTPLALDKLVKTGETSGVVVDVSTIDQVEKFLSYYALPEFNLILVLGLSKNLQLKNWYSTLKLFSSIIFLIFFCSLYFLYRYLISNQKAELNRLKMISSSKLSSLGEMAGGVAHEINNPLAIIKGRTEQSLKHIDDNNYDINKIRSNLISTLTTVERITKIVKGLRHFSRSAEGDPKEITSLSKIIDETLDICSEKFRSNQIDLRKNNLSDEIYINCRSVEISQVMLNLLNNSYDVVRELSEKWIEISIEKKDKKIFLIITDSGKGISLEVQQKLMQPFFTTKPMGQGTGLGLSISKGIIEEHGGKLSFNTKAAHTQFIIELPLI